MPKVTQPLFSEKASGDLGKAIQFRCGKFVVKKPVQKKGGESALQNIQREKFKDGSKVWTEGLTPEQKESWEDFSKSIRNEKGWFTIDTPFGPIYHRIGIKEDWKECIETATWNGYQYFLSCYLTFGLNGWTDYPDPPSFP